MPDPEPAGTEPEPVMLAHQRRSRAFRRVALAAVGVVIALGLLGLLGPRLRSATASTEGLTVTVRYASVTRPGLATPWIVEVHHAGGFEGKISIATSATYFDGFDLNALYPDPMSHNSRGDVVVFTFRRPPGETFQVRFDGRATPTWTLWRSATTVVSGVGLPEASVSYRTLFLP